MDGADPTAVVEDLVEPPVRHPVDRLVDRDVELGLLRARLDEAAAARRGAVVAVSGEPGIGKTRLGEELAAVARPGWRTVVGRCWDGGDAPLYWPWRQAVRRLVALAVPEGPLPASLRPLAHVARELRERVADGGALPADAADARFVLAEAIVDLLARATASAPVLLVLDDLHAADAPSVQLLALLADRLRELPVLVYVAYRRPELASSPRVHELVTRLEHDAYVLRLEGLGLSGVTELAESVAGCRLPPDLPPALLEHTGGNPLHLREQVRLLAAETVLSAATSRPLAVPSGVVGTISQRVDLLLGPEGRRPLEVAAVLGRVVDVPTLLAAAAAPTTTVLDALGRAVDLGFLTRDESSPLLYRFSHALVRESLVQGLPPLRRQELHRAAAEALEASGAREDERVGVLAHHWYQAGVLADPVRAVAALRGAAAAAVRLAAYDDAVVALERALEVRTLTGPAAPADEADVLLELGQTLNRSGAAGPAQAVFLRAARLARAAGSGPLLARAAVGYGRESSASGVVDTVLVGLLDEALTALGAEDPALRVDVLTRLALELYYDAASTGRRTELAAEAVRLARRLDDPTLLSYAVEASTLASAGPDNLAARLAAGAEIIALADAAGRREGRQSGHVWRCAALLELGDRAGLETELVAYRSLVDQLRQPAHTWYVTMLEATSALLTGSLPEAERLVEEAGRIGASARSGEAADYLVVQRWALHRELGGVDGAAELEPQLRALAHRRPALPVFRAALAAVLLDLGREADARREVQAAAPSGLSGLGRDLGWVSAVAVLGECAARSGDVATCREVAGLLEPYRGRLVVVDWSMAALDPVDTVLGAVLAAAGEDEAAAGALRAAAAWADGAGAIRARARAEALAARTPRPTPGRPAEPHAATGVAAAPAVEGAVLQRAGDAWTVGFGGTTVSLRHSRGLTLLAQLLAHPGRELHVLDLVAREREVDPAGWAGAEAGVDAVEGFGDAGPVLDAQAKDAYRRRLADLDDDLLEAERAGDRAAAARATEERDFLVRELAAAVGLHGQDRRAAAPAERARVSATKSVRTVLRRIDEAHPALGAHLRSTVHTGYYCAYTPDPRAPLTWVT